MASLSHQLHQHLTSLPFCLSVSPWVTRLAVWSAHLVPGQISHTCLIRWTLNHDCCAQSCMKHNPLSLTDTLYLPKNVSESVHVGHVSEWARRNGRLKMAVREREIKHMYVCTAQRIAGRHRKSMINMCLWFLMFVFCGPNMCSVGAGQIWVTAFLFFCNHNLNAMITWFTEWAAHYTINGWDCPAVNFFQWKRVQKVSMFRNEIQM